MTRPHERALEAAARALIACRHEDDDTPDVVMPTTDYDRDLARAAVTAYQAALPPPVSPELIAGLNRLASYLTEQGEYEAVDLIDTVVARVIDAAPPSAQDHRP